MPEFTDALNWSASGSIHTVVGVGSQLSPSASVSQIDIAVGTAWEGDGSMTVTGLVEPPPLPNPQVPQNIRRRRRQVQDLMHRVGMPVLIKPMYTSADVEAGVAQKSPAFASAYDQTRWQDPLSHGVGFCSIALSPNEWYSLSTGEITVSNSNPGSGYVRAPYYRGFGPGVLTYIIGPDSPHDFFKVNEIGTFIKVQSAQIQAGWEPIIHDNDLIIEVITNSHSDIIATGERYQAKMVTPVTIRGNDRRGQKENAIQVGGNRWLLNQNLEAALVPKFDTLQSVETDR